MAALLCGTGVSRGVAVGRVLLVEAHPDAATVAPHPVDAADEIARLTRARDRARADLADLREKVRRALGDHFSAMLEVQMLILDDPALVAETERRIRATGTSAAWALQETVGEFLARLDTAQAGVAHERGGDLEDVHRRLQRLLRGAPPARGGPGEGPLILVAHSLGPSEAVALVRDGIVGLATDLGGPTSHTAILAQALAVPAVVGLHDVSRRARSGDPIVVDGESGTVEIDPASDRLEGAARRREEWLRRESVLDSVPPVAPATRDGVRLVLRANIELPEQLAPAVRLGAEGIGLYRSEFLFLTRAPALPTEEEHCAAYRAMAESVAPHPAVIRTLDLGGDKYFQEVLAEGGGEASLGLRAVRFCLRRPDVFLPQLRGLLRAGVHGDVRVLVPMITSRDEILEVRRLLAREAEALKAHGVPCRDTLPLGAMVEVPAAAATADALAEVCDFLSIGTNDLIQYALAVDRGDDAVAHLYRPLHPGVLRMMDFTVRSAAARGIPVSLCGEMAGNPGLAALLVGLGLRELSVEPRVLPAVAEALRQVDAAAAASLAARALALGDPAAVERLIHGEPRGA